MRHIKICDEICSSENIHVHGLRGVVMFGKGRHTVHRTDPFGRPFSHSVFDQLDYVGENIVPIGGYQFAFDKLFNIGLDEESTLRVGDLNDDAPMMRIGVNRSYYRSPYYNAEASIGFNNIPDGIDVSSKIGVNIPAMNFIFGFMIGDGGVRQDGTKPIAPDYKNRNLFHPIPFRVTDEDLSEGGIYFGKTQLQSVDSATERTAYYVKVFDDPKPHIVHALVSDNNQEMSIVDDSIFSSTTSKAIESYVEINFSISAEDTREYYGEDVVPYINEFGLVSGWYNSDPEQRDYESIRLFTKFTRPSILLDTNDHIEGIYRLYAR